MVKCVQLIYPLPDLHPCMTLAIKPPLPYKNPVRAFIKHSRYFIKQTISLQSNAETFCIYTCLIKQKLSLVMKENWSSVFFCRVSPKEKEVAYNQSAMHILHFYFVGQSWQYVYMYEKAIQVQQHSMMIRLLSQQNSYSISHLLDTVTKWYGIWVLLWIKKQNVSMNTSIFSPHLNHKY